MNRHFLVILHYFELWILNKYFELLTTQSPVFIESQLTGARREKTEKPVLQNSANKSGPWQNKRKCLRK